MINVVVYDDSKGRLEGLEMLINNTGDMRCIGTFENCADVVNQMSNLFPDVVLMDIDMPKVNGIEGLKLIRQVAPKVMVIMQTVFENEEKIFEAIKHGAHGYFIKKTSPLKLIDGIRDVLEGGAPMTASVAKKVLDYFQSAQTQKIKVEYNLSITEKEILNLLVKGMSYKMIAESQNIDLNTVNTHCKCIYDKLHVHSAPEAIAVALENKIV
jgi:DNA-binding NarL/FixJ family response regulator